MKLSVIILNYNVSYFLRQCILSVQESLVGIESEILIVDNNSQDDSCKMVRHFFPELTLIQNKENIGFSKANNQAVAIAKGEFVCILNPDTAVTKETFKKVLEFAETKNDMGALGVRLIDGTGNYLPESKRNVPRPKVAFYKIMGLKSKKYSYYSNHINENETAPVEVLVGAFMLLRREVYNQVGGFDEDYFMYGEDIDLSFKLLKNNYKNYYVGNVTVLHYKGESTTKDKTYLKRFYGAMHIFYKKHFKSNSIFKTLVFAGVSFAKVLSIFRGNKSVNAIDDIENYFLLSDNISFLRKLSDASGINLKSLSKSAVTDVKTFNSYFIFDANYISYEKIFKTMEFHKNKGNVFRIRPVNTDYLIGSDSSNSKGENFDFSKENN